MTAAGDRLNAIRYSRTWYRETGGVTVFLGRLTRAGSDSPRIYAAALSDADLRGVHWRRGYGPTEDAAIAALLNKADN